MGSILSWGANAVLFVVGCFLAADTANAILTPKQFQRFRVPLHTASIIEIAGPLQNADDVIHVRVRELRPLVPREALPRSHDYR